MSIEELRQEASESPFAEEETGLAPSSVKRPYKVRYLGMTAVQTFIIAALLLLIACLLSTFCLLATGRVVPSFLI
ncbi:MAG: hypothetical protein A2W35_02700 [Chloroflexi bacterium RBG_16_57_11]|nr:MAG: hypothetical protein A2W35_02700 [Chloroflexi bacterium RBG_16_57_11]